MLPCVAFADSSTMFNFFTPLSTDYSISALQSIFGTMSNILPGRGNQLLGTVVGIFNACWVVAIGIAVIFLVWDSIMHAAQSGAGMAGHGRKSVLKIIGIVIGFTLAVPSSTTGYSLGQNGVVWVVVQGVGIADKIYTKMYDYFMQGGVAVTMDPPPANDMKAFMNPAGTILQGQICLAKLEAIKIEERRANADVAKTLGELPSYTSNDVSDQVGYSINSDNSITMGTINDKYVASDPTSHRFNDECGKVTFQYKQGSILARMAGMNYSPEEFEQEKNQTMQYVRSATIDLFNSLQSAARQIAAIDPNTSSNPDASDQFQAIAPTGAEALANSGITFSTVIDPARRLVMVNRGNDLANSMEGYHEKGWIFTPFMMTIPGLYDGQVVSIANYTPSVVAPDVARLTSLSPSQRNEITQLIGHVDSDDYVINAMADLDAYYTNTNLTSDLSFEAFLAQYNPEEDTRSVDKIVDMIDQMMTVPKQALSFTKGFSEGLLQGLGDTLGGINTVIGVFQGMDDFFKQVDRCLDSLDNVTEGDSPKCDIKFDLGGGDSGLKDAQEALYGAGDYVADDIQTAISAIDDMMTKLRQDADYSKQGGMNNSINDLTKQIGPVGPILAMMLTSMIGKGFNILEDNVALNNNAMMTSIKVGGGMMTASLEAVFSAGQALYVSSLVEGALSGVGSVLGYGSSGASGLATSVPGGAVGIANRAMGIVIPAYIALALFFFAGGMLLYILVPLTWILLFAAVALRWMGLVVINVLAAPIFCFNLVRADGEGLIGKGDRFLADLVRTMITPAVLVVGAIAFMLLFNISFQLIAYLLTNFLPLLFKIKSHAYLVSISLAAILMVFGILMAYMSNLLANLCTSDLINAVGSSVDHVLGEVKGMPGMHEQMQHGLSGVSEHIGAPAKSLTVDNAEGLKKGIKDMGDTYVKARDQAAAAANAEAQAASEAKQENKPQPRNRNRNNNNNNN